MYASSMYDFEKVISDKELEDEQDEVKTLLDNAHVFNWNEIPGVWKKFKTPSKIEIKSLNYNDEGIAKLSDIYSSTDVLQERMQGVYFYEKGVFMTDAHKLLYISGDVKNKGIYRCSKFSKNQSNKIEIKEKFPDCEAVIPADSSYVGKVKIEKLLSYLRCNDNYFNRITKQVNFAYGKDLVIGFNSEFLSDILGSFYSLGYKEIYVGLNLSNRPIILSNNENVCKKPKSSIGKKDVIIGLLMPLYLYDGEFLGARDMDFHTENQTYYDFKDGEIHNKDGSIAEYNANEPEYTDILTKEQVEIIKSVVNNKNINIPILETAKIVNGYSYFMSINDYEVKMKVNGLIENGCYSYVDGYLRKTDYDIDDFPMFNQNKFKSFAVSKTREFAERLEYASLFTGNDVLRILLMSVNLEFKNNNLKFNSTDSYLLYSKNFKIETKSDLTFNLSSSDKIAKILNLIENDSMITFSNSNDDYKRLIQFSTDTITITSIEKDSKFPDIKSVVPKKFDYSFSMEPFEFTKLITKQNEKLTITENIIKNSSNSKIKVNTFNNNLTLDEVENFILFSSLTPKSKKPFSMISGVCSVKTKKVNDINYFYIKLDDNNLPFYRTRPFKSSVKEKIQFAPIPKTQIDTKNKKTESYTREQELKEIDTQIYFANMMLESSKTKTEKNAWIDILNTLKLLK